MTTAMAARSTALVAVTCLALAGCRAYAPRPIDLADTDAALARRLSGDDLGALAAFASGLSSSGLDHPVEFDVGDGLDVAEGEVVALFYNPDLRMARLGAGVTRATAEHAGRWSDPEFGFDAAQILSPDSLFQFGGMLHLTLPLSGRLGAERDRASAAHRATLASIVATEWDLRIAVREQWRRWSAARMRAEVAAEMLGRLDAVLPIARRLGASGEFTRIEARLFELERAKRGHDHERLVAAARAMELDLRALMGLPADHPVVLVPALGAPPPVPADDARLHDHPHLQARLAAYEVAESALRVEIRRQYPDLTLGGGYGEEDDERLLFGLSIPVPILNANRGGIAEAEAQREVARVDVETTLERLRSAAALADLTYADALAARRRLDDTIIPLLDQQIEDVRRVAELGDVDALLFMETLERQRDVRLALVDATLDEAIAAIRIDALRGPNPADLPPSDATAGDQP